jgi:TRAP-type transport system periplasmic protein
VTHPLAEKGLFNANPRWKDAGEERERRNSMIIGQAGKICIVSAALALAVGAGSAQAQTFELKLSHFVPPNHAFHKWATAWTEQLGKDSGGRLKFQIYPNGQLVGPPNRQFDAARNAVVDISFTLHGVTPGRYAMTELANLPFSWPTAGSGSATTSRRMSDLAPTYLEKEHQGLRVLYMAVANPVVFNCKSAIRTLDQFKGVKIRYAGVQNKYLIDALGAVPLLVPPPESQDALAKGIVECALFPFEASVAYDLGAVAKHATVPGVSTATFAMVMNPAKYDSLPADLKALIDKSTGPAAAESFGKAWEVAEKHGRDQVVGQGVQLHSLSDGDVQAMKKMMAPHIETALAALEKDGKPARKFFSEYTK